MSMITLLSAQGIATPQHLTKKRTTIGPVDVKQAVTTLAFGSCNNQEKDQMMWKPILSNTPDLWVWLGDNIYADTDDMALMKKMYQKVLKEPDYAQLCQKTSVMGIWDDHDYGQNDGDKNYQKKEESKALMLNFLEVPKDDPVWKREGAYQSYTMGPAGSQIKVILLDGRYFRDELVPNPSKTPRYFNNETGDMLGEAQWKWLEEELRNSTAQINIIACGIQFVHDEHAFEKWGNFPAARQRFFELLVKIKPTKTLLLSGDRHISEVSKIDLPGLGYPLYDFTSSGLTHAYSGNTTETNRYRVSPLVNQRSFGVLRIDWSAPSPRITMEARGLDNIEFFKLEF
ncbi:alkaline phosphatase D family protein [Haliscomenobacter hydrossis]|nr:alkaline phosphatase D family protein [Haliscomenobacter hydrossis]